MKKIILVFVFLIANILIFAQKVYLNRTPKTYYISLTGSNSNDGLTTGTAWRTLTYAVSIASPVQPGDVIYEKAGSYGNENIVFEKNGLPGSPITIIGYKTTPKDQPALIVNNVDPYAAYSTTEMPTYTGTTRNSGTAFNMVNSQYIILKNFQVTTYYRAYFLGFNTPANYSRKCGIEMYNCNAMALGDLSAAYSGFGISAGLPVYEIPPTVAIATHSRANHCKFISCLIVNAGVEGISVYGDYCTVVNCKVYCNETSNVLDYFINICGSYNTITRCHVEGSDGSFFGGTHGIGVKSNAEQVIDLGRTMPPVNPTYNRFSECSSKNVGEGFFVRHRGCQYNSFVKCNSIGTHTGVSGSSGNGDCIVIRDGASNNTFTMCYGEGLTNGITFLDTTEDGDSGNTPGHPGNGNVITNCVFYNCYFGIHFDDYDTPSNAGANTVANSTFYLCRYVHGCFRACSQMTYKNNIYYGNSALGYGGYFKGGTFPGDVTVSQFSNCCFYNIPSMTSGFVGTNSNIGTDPLFVTLGTLGGTAPNLRLQSSSPSKDAGLTITTILYDFEGKIRPYGASYSIGAYDR